MSILPEITDLFARLASHLEASSPSRLDAIDEDEDEGEKSTQLSVFNLKRSLNLEDDSRVRVLDTALSLMCFRAPQVFDSMVRYYLETITAVMSFSIGCKVLRFQKDDFLVIGSSISRQDCVGFIENFSDVLAKLEEHGPQYERLSKAILRVLISSSTYRNMIPSRPILDARLTDARSITISKFLGSFPNSLSFGACEIPFRLQSWFLDPLTLKHDISNILRESTKRPFLCLCREFHERLDWRSIAKCFALSPTMFIETRALLHRWFLLTGLAPVLDLLIGICSVMLDVILRPTWWDLSMELGAKLPFSSAYFPHQHHIFRIFSGPLSHARFLHLVHLIDESSPPCNGTHIDQVMKSSSARSEGIEHKSAWALAISFPCWFYFASVLLFSEKGLQGESVLGVPVVSNNVKTSDKEPSSAAARYIAWTMNPSSKSEQESLAGHLIKISKSLALRQCNAGTHNKKKARNKKIPMKPKLLDAENNICPEQYGRQAISLWLEEFISFGDQSKLQNALFRRIPLGLLLGHLSNLDRDASELLLHYATSQKLVQFMKADFRSLKRMKHDRIGQRDIVPWINDYSSEEALMGARLVFCLTDNAESLSTSFSDTDEAGQDFVCHVKMKVGNFLIKCLNRLIELKVDNRIFFAMDLCQRLKQWTHQGQKILEINKDFDDIFAVLSDKLSSI